MHVIMTPVGSAGDVLPFVALGRRLRERGHDVVLLTNEYFREMVEGSGVSFGAVGSKARYSAAMDDPDLWHPSRGSRVVIQQMVAQTAEMYHAVAERARPGESVLLCTPGATGASLVQEKMNLPMATLFLQPNLMFGIHGLLVTPSMRRLDWTPIWLRQCVSLLTGRLVLDRMVRRPINEIRAQIGLSPADRWMSAWEGKPSLEIGLFPEWFASCRQAETERMHLTGFLSYSGEDVRKTPNELSDFLDSGDPPLVFTAGTANKQAHQFFAVGAEATARIGRRAVLLTPFRDQVPVDLPDGVIQIDYAPLPDFLPRTAAIIHHGGVGTLARALAAGIPQLIVPYGLDQPANAIRVSDLGAGDYLPFKKVNERALSEKLCSLLDNQEMRRVARGYAEKIARQDASSETCDLVETLPMVSTQRA